MRRRYEALLKLGWSSDAQPQHRRQTNPSTVRRAVSERGSVRRGDATVSGLAAGASGALGSAVFERLAELDEIAAGVRRRSREDLDRVRQEMTTMIRAWRRLLLAHAPDERGRCLRCRGWLVARRWPCGVWSAARSQLMCYDVAADICTGSRTGPDRHPARSCARALAGLSRYFSPAGASPSPPRAGSSMPPGPSASSAVPPGVTIMARRPGPGLRTEAGDDTGQ